MSGEKECRMRLRWPSGAEFEAEGPQDFVARESRDFLLTLQRHPAAAADAGAAAEAEQAGIRVFWEQICQLEGRDLQLRAKLPAGSTERDACLVLLACAQKRLGQAKPTATQLAKWLRRSGYPIGRMDRALQDAVAEGQVLAAGSRRARRYELTAPGRLKALLLAERLSVLVGGKP